MSQNKNTQTILEVNSLLPVHSLWDGYWVHDFSQGKLTVSGSFNRIYYRDFDVIFYGVTFFNLPDEWRDTDVPGDDLLREAGKAEFHGGQPEFDPGNKLILAIDLAFPTADRGYKKQTFYIVCDSVEAVRCTPEDSKPYRSYEDPLANEPWPCKKNRVSLL